MRYDKVRFNSGITGEGYQEIDNGSMVRLTDLDGNAINSVDDMSYTVVQADSPTPSWGTPDV